MEEINGFRIALFALLLTLGAWASYWAKIKALTVPRNPIVYQVAMVVGASLAVWGLVRGAGVGGAALAVAALVAAGFFLFTSLISRVPETTLAVSVGDAILDFTTEDADGSSFALSELAGRPFLLKFFRGHW
jgi:hypothetical protein